jgi:hypothetical protein
VILAGDCFASLAMTPGRPGTEDFTEAVDEGVPFLGSVQEVAKFKPLQKSLRVNIAH